MVLRCAPPSEARRPFCELYREQRRADAARAPPAVDAFILTIELYHGEHVTALWSGWLTSPGLVCSSGRTCGVPLVGVGGGRHEAAWAEMAAAPTGHGVRVLVTRRGHTRLVHDGRLEHTDEMENELYYEERPLAVHAPPRT